MRDKRFRLPNKVGIPMRTVRLSAQALSFSSILSMCSIASDVENPTTVVALNLGLAVDEQWDLCRSLSPFGGLPSIGPSPENSNFSPKSNDLNLNLSADERLELAKLAAAQPVGTRTTVRPLSQNRQSSRCSLLQCWYYCCGLVDE